MEWALFTTAGFEQLGRYTHFLAGVIWIGTLYYFNFIQVPFFGETDAPTKSNAIQKLVPRALWWFRWGAKVTFLSGLYLIHSKMKSSGLGMGIFTETAWGPLITPALLMGTIMYLNVWMIIWPKQKIVIASTKAVAEGKPADPKAAAAGALALLASRTNTTFSVPLLFFMGAGAHLPIAVNIEKSLMLAFLIPTLIILAIEANVLFFRKLGVLSTIKGVWTCGFSLTALFYVLIEYLTK